jgi:cytochrome b561
VKRWRFTILQSMGGARTLGCKIGMQLVNSPKGYGAIPQALHWLTVICVIAGWLLGQLMDAFPKGPPRVSALWTHMLLGELVIAFLVARLVWRILDPPPPLEPTLFGRWLTVVSTFGHFMLYGLLVAVPLVGIIVQLKEGRALPIFGLGDVLSPWPRDHETAESILQVHEVLANALLILAGIHAAAALIHHYVLGDRTLVRMLPGGSGRSA